MRYEEIMLDFLSREELLDEREDDVGLDGCELMRLAFFAEHPELSDPVIWFIR
ncbi:hypothetical protein ACFL1X_04130 [Candidatus Hydrogenedentota bacterium]